MSRKTALFALLILYSFSLLRAEGLLYVRLRTPLSTSESRPGDRFTGEVTSPLLLNGDAAVPVGAVVRGTVLEVRAVGLGLRRERARLELRADELVLPSGETVPLAAQLAGFDNARESLDGNGRIRGIRSTQSLGDRMNVRLGGVRLTPFRLAYRSAVTAFPWQTAAVWFTNGLLFGMTDPEIRYAAGSDFQLRLHGEWQHEARFPVYRGEDPDGAPAASELRDFLGTQESLSYFEKTGAEADPVNLVLLGSPSAAFAAAGWQGADQPRRRNCFRALKAVATDSAYETGPMTPLMLAGQRPDAEWQKSLNTYAKRHHLRIWRAARPWQGQDAWLVAATHDTGLTVEGRRLTHRVDPHIDAERERVIADLLLTRCVDSVTYVERPIATTRRWVTDGRVAVVALNACATPVAAPPAQSWPRRSAGWRLAQRASLNARNTILRENNAYRGYDFVRQIVRWKRADAAEKQAPHE